MFAGIKGMGPNDYGQPSPGDCSIYQGYHCDPYEHQVLFYDVLELAEVAAGNRSPWSVTPYEVWSPTELYGGGSATVCGDLGGATFDEVTGRWFVVETGLGNDDSAVVHVWGLQ